MTLFRRKFISIPSAGHNVGMEFVYPKKRPRSAVIVCQGLRSSNRGQLSNMAMAMVRQGYLGVKFDFVGTGRSDGKFEEKLTSVMLKNLEDVIDRVAEESGITRIGIVARSNSAALLTIHGDDPRIHAIAMLAPTAYYAVPFRHFIDESKRVGKWLYHKSFKRKHTKGEGRLPMSFFTELKKYAPTVLKNIRVMRNVIHFQSDTDEVLRNDGHFEYLRDHLPSPKKSVQLHGVTHSLLPDKQHVAIEETVQWFKKFL